MGNRFSTDPDRSEILVRDKDGKIKLYKGTHMEAQGCNRMPILVEPGVSYLFLPSSGFHAHPYYDQECDTPANDVIYPETTIGGKHLNSMVYATHSNAHYFEFSKDLPNKPDHPSFYSGPKGSGEARKTSKRAFNKCTQVPFGIKKETPISFSHNNTPLIFFTDSECTNEYIIPLTEGTSVPPRTVENTIFDVPYSKYTSYTKPAEATNAMYYRTYRDVYPDIDKNEQKRLQEEDKKKEEQRLASQKAQEAAARAQQAFRAQSLFRVTKEIEQKRTENQAKEIPPEEKRAEDLALQKARESVVAYLKSNTFAKWNSS